jgi:hypothetical protein
MFDEEEKVANFECCSGHRFLCCFLLLVNRLKLLYIFLIPLTTPPQIRVINSRKLPGKRWSILGL